MPEGEARSGERGINKPRRAGKVTVYEVVTDKVLKLLDRGVAPWRAAWKLKDGYPQNLDSKRPYRGFNCMYLAFAQMVEGWEHPYYLTFQGAQKRGWHVRAGEVGNLVVFYKVEETKETDPVTLEEKIKRRYILRYYHVFNLAQIEGWTPADLPDPRERVNPIRDCEELIGGFIDGLPPIEHGKPAYWPGRDVITLPYLEEFEHRARYYSTRYHETVHATGARQRLNRPGITETVAFGSERYSLEELIAEIGAAFLNALSGIEEHVIEDNAAYIAAWREKLSNNPEWIVKASSAAQRAVDYLLGELTTPPAGSSPTGTS